ncbi:meiosis regulator and mRNA stability factor 1 isoform X2 [Brassica napus]|uniref:meiosis regulator and mRNA stability factor 1 isoform X2 n=1 Tax=Brassica napus TaxID=3708 RepID=UPI0020797A2E|nr:meiosis regulator and mRNA stability factor 1 isoform X2 [Brassica napus]
MTMAEYSKVKTSVWWDIENCEVPKGWDAHAIAQNLGSALLDMNYCGPVSILAYGDTNLIPHHVQQALSSTGVGLNHVPAGVKDASDKKILVDMLLWAVDNPAPANIMLISGDRDFSNALHQLSMRRYTILLAQPPRASAPLVAAAKNVWLWTSLASGGPPLTSGESSGPVNNGRCNVSNPVSELAQSSKPTGSTSVVGDTNVTSSDSFRAHLSDKRQTSQAAFVASHKAHASVSVKPIQEADVVEPVLCTVCQISCISKEVYARHTYGKRHRHNLELQSGKVPGPAVFPKEVLTRQNRRIRRRSRKALIDSKKLQEKGVGEKFQPREAIAQSQFKKKYVAMVNQSEEVEERGEGEKRQPVETITESLLHCQNTQENNTKSLEKQSKELREILFGTSESSVQEKLPRTKDQAETVNKQLPNEEARECFDGIVRPLNQSQGATDNHSGDVKKKKKQKEVMERRSKLCHHCVVICDSQGVSTLVCSNIYHWTNHPLAAFVDDAVWCQVCQTRCNSKAAYENHTYGKKHRQNLELQSAKNENMSKGQAKLSEENAKDQTAFDSQNNAAMVKEQTDAFVDSKKNQEESDQGAQEEDKEEVKEVNAVSENLVHVFNGLNRESRIPKESRGCLDVIPERVIVPPDVNVTGKFEDESKHKQEREKECAGGGKEHPGEAGKREESKKVQVDKLWTRLWWGKS